MLSDFSKYHFKIVETPKFVQQMADKSHFEFSHVAQCNVPSSCGWKGLRPAAEIPELLSRAGNKQQTHHHRKSLMLLFHPLAELLSLSELF